MKRPTVKVVKPRSMSGGVDSTVLIYVEGPHGQRLRLYVSPGQDGIMRFSVEHNESTEALGPPLVTTRWWTDTERTP